MTESKGHADAGGAEWVAGLDTRVGREVRRAREWAQLSQAALADAMTSQYGFGWHQTTVGKVEAGERPLRLTEWMAVSRTLGVSLQELVDGEVDGGGRLGIEAALVELARVQSALETRIAALRNQLVHGHNDDAKHRTPYEGVDPDLRILVAVDPPAGIPEVVAEPPEAAQRELPGPS